MKGEIKDALEAVAEAFRSKTFRAGAALLLLCCLAFAEYFGSGLVRRTFVFYSLRDGKPIVEDRMLAAASSDSALRGGEAREQNIRRYVEEALLGPAAPGSAPLFPRETRLRSLLYRNGTVYVDLSESAALPYEAGGDAGRDFDTLRAGILRNFPYIGSVRLFVGGKAPVRG